MPPHIRLRDLPRTAWTQAIAYAATAQRKNGRPKFNNPKPWAAAAWLGVLLVQSLFGHRNIYATPSKQGVVALLWHPPLGLIARLLIFLAPLLIAAFMPLQVITWISVAYLAALVSSLVLQGFTGQRSSAPKGTKKRNLPIRRVTFGTIASHPDAHELEATLLAARLVKSLPPESTVVAHPRTKALRAQYQKAGFAPSSGKAMILVT